MSQIEFTTAVSFIINLKKSVISSLVSFKEKPVYDLNDRPEDVTDCVRVNYLLYSRLSPVKKYFSRSICTKRNTRKRLITDALSE